MVINLWVFVTFLLKNLLFCLLLCYFALLYQKCYFTMKRLLLVLLIAAVAAMAVNAQSTPRAADVITLVKEGTLPLMQAEDLAANLLKHFDDVFIPQGYTKGLTGDGYGGPCVIIDGYYRGGHADTEYYYFVPDDPLQACVVEIGTCNDGDESDYFSEVSVAFYHETNANDMLRQLLDMGMTWRLSSQGTPEFFGQDVVVTYNFFEQPNGAVCFNFSFETMEHYQHVLSIQNNIE